MRRRVSAMTAPRHVTGNSFGHFVIESQQAKDPVILSQQAKDQVVEDSPVGVVRATRKPRGTSSIE